MAVTNALDNGQPLFDISLVDKMTGHLIFDAAPYFRGKPEGDRRLVTVRRDKDGKIIGHEKIKTNKLGQPGFDFNRWVKLPKMPELLLE